MPRECFAVVPYVPSATGLSAQGLHYLDTLGQALTVAAFCQRRSVGVQVLSVVDPNAPDRSRMEVVKIFGAAPNTFGGA